MIHAETDIAQRWVTPPARLTLPPHDVHLWRADLNRTGAVQAAACALLSDDERARADRFIRPEHGRRFAIARASLRAILSRYVDRAPETLEFAYGERGKPYLASDALRGIVEFNVSHSGDCALIACARSMAVGVDVEHRRDRVDAEKIAKRFFAQAEVDALSAVPKPSRLQAFYNCWTRKEAYVKARGAGLSIKLSSFVVSLAPGHAPALLSAANDDGEEQPKCSMYAIEPGPGYTGAAAILGEVRSLRYFEGSGVF